MSLIKLMVRKFCLAILVISMFNLMAVGLNLYIPFSIANVLIVAFFDIFGFITLVVYYMFIL